MTSGVYSPPKGTHGRVTVEEFERMPPVEGEIHELIRGRVSVMPPPGFDHGIVAGIILRLIANFVVQNRLGYCFAAETGFRIGANTVRAADVAFLSKARMPGSRVTGYFQGAPDLVVEVLSPSDRFSDVMEKVRDWLDGGAAQVWVVDLDARSVTIYRVGVQPVNVLHDTDTLDGGDVLPGFSVLVADLFPVYQTAIEP